MPGAHHEALKTLAERLEPELPAMLDEQEAAVERELPGLAARIDPVLARHAIDHTNRRFIAMLRGERMAAGRAVHVEFGAVCARAGVALDEVTAGYRLGARVAWRRTAAQVEALQLPASVALQLAEGWLIYADELARESLEGYEREAAVARGVQARARQELVSTLLAGRDASAAAARAAWPLPDRLVAGVPLGDEPLDPALLVGHADGATVLIAPADADITAPVALGPPVAPAATAVSLARARRLAALAAAGIIDAGTVLRWEDHLPTLLIHADAAAAEALATTRLAPLAGLPPRRRRMLTETLEAWLAHPGQPLQIARALHLHPQTVRYRLARLREHLGDTALDDPEHRFELGLALRSQGSRGASPL